MRREGKSPNPQSPRKEASLSKKQSEPSNNPLVLEELEKERNILESDPLVTLTQTEKEGPGPTPSFNTVLPYEIPS